MAEGDGKPTEGSRLVVTGHDYKRLPMNRPKPGRAELLLSPGPKPSRQRCPTGGMAPVGVQSWRSRLQVGYLVSVDRASAILSISFNESLMVELTALYFQLALLTVPRTALTPPAVISVESIF